MSVTPLLSPLCQRAYVKTMIGIAAADTSQDDLLDLMIDSATSTINDYVGYPLLKPSGDPTAEYYSGDGSPNLVLKRRPVQSVASIYVDPTGAWGQGPSAFAATTLLVAGTDYALNLERDANKGMAGIVRRLATSVEVGWPTWSDSRGTLTSYGRSKIGWPVGDGNIKVTYTAGFTSLTDTTFPVPPSVQQACANLAVFIKKIVPNGGFITVTESLSKYSSSLGLLSETARNALAGAGELGSTRQILSRYRDMAL